MIAVSFFGVGDADLLPHFISYYRKLGVSGFRFTLHGAWPDEVLVGLAEQPDCMIVAQTQAEYTETFKREFLTDMTRDLVGQWVVLVDADEFLELPLSTLTRTIACLQVLGATSLPALMLQRHAADGSLTEILPDTDLDESFPMMQFGLVEAMGVVPPIWKTKYPLALVTDKFRHEMGNHLPPSGRADHLYPIRGTVHHFKWRAALKDSLRIPRMGANQSERAQYEHYLKTNGWQLPTRDAVPYSRAELLRIGILVRPDRHLTHSMARVRKAMQRRAMGPPAAPLEAIGAVLETLADSRYPPFTDLLATIPRPAGKVCLVGFEITGPVTSGGIATALGALAERLALLGHDVHVLFCPYQGYAALWEGWREYWSSRGVRLHYLPRADPAVGTYPDHRTFSSRVADWLRPHDFDVLHFVDADACGAAVVLERAAGLGFQSSRIITTVHGPAVWHHEGNALMLTRDNLENDHALASLLQFSDVVCSPSRYMLDWVRQRYRSGTGKYIVVPNCLPGFSRSFKSVRAERETKTVNEIVFFGRPEPRKGTGVFCDAIRQLVERGFEKFQVTLLGRSRSPEEPGNTVSVLSALDLPVKVLEDFDGIEALNYLKTHQCIAVMPSTRDNAPYTVIECIEAGVPLVTTRVGGIPELVVPADRDRLIEPGDAAALAACLADALTHGARPFEPAFDPLMAELTQSAVHAELISASNECEPLPTTMDGDCDELVFGGTDELASIPAKAVLAIRNKAKPLFIRHHSVSIVEQDAVRAMLALMNNSRADAVVCDYFVSLPSATASRHRIAAPAGPAAYASVFNLFGAPCFLMAPGVATRLSNVLDEFGQIDARWWHWVVLNHLLASGGSVESVPRPLVCWRVARARDLNHTDHAALAHLLKKFGALGKGGGASTDIVAAAEESFEDCPYTQAARQHLIHSHPLDRAIHRLSQERGKFSQRVRRWIDGASG